MFEVRAANEKDLSGLERDQAVLTKALAEEEKKYREALRQVKDEQAQVPRRCV